MAITATNAPKMGDFNTPIHGKQSNQTQEAYTAPKILRIKQIKAQTGLPNSTVYYHIQQGLFTRPIKLGERMSGWLESEVNAIMAARIAGKSEAEIKTLVQSLENDRVANWG